jgi:hypothetical protein
VYDEWYRTKTLGIARLSNRESGVKEQGARNS